jgi:PAS domain S-box-containing protein
MVLAVIGGAVFAAWTAGETDRSMREDLLTETALASTGIDARDLFPLNGSATDLKSTYYTDLKEQLAQVREAHPLCRFAYVMGRRTDGTVFFYADSESPESRDYSPPGQVYAEANETAVGSVFSTGIASVAGPMSDRWGVWVSGLVPVVDPANGRVVGLFGMDVDARDWNGQVLVSTGPPIAMTLLILVLLVAFARFSLSSDRERRQLERSEAAMRASENLYRAIFENTASGTFIIEEDTTISLANARLAELSGYAKEEIEGRMSWTVLTDPRDRDRMLHYHHSRRRSHGAAPSSYGFRFRTRSGEIRQVLIHVGMIPGTMKSVASLHDITDLKQAEEALQRSNRKLVYLSQLTKTELANRVFILHGFLDLASHAVEGNERVRGLFARSLDAVGEMNAVLALARNYGDLGVNPALWQDVRLAFLLGISHLPMEGIRVEVETGDLEVYADPLLERAFQGLVNNSLVHGGSVTTVRLAAYPDDHGIMIVYEDDGDGIPTEEKETIFSLDVREGEGRIRGLVFVRELLDITGIQIRENGVMGRGVRFELSVPAGSWRHGAPPEAGKDEGAE